MMKLVILCRKKEFQCALCEYWIENEFKFNPRSTFLYECVLPPHTHTPEKIVLCIFHTPVCTYRLLTKSTFYVLYTYSLRINSGINYYFTLASFNSLSATLSNVTTERLISIDKRANAEHIVANWKRERS